MLYTEVANNDKCIFFEPYHFFPYPYSYCRNRTNNEGGSLWGDSGDSDHSGGDEDVEKFFR